MRKYLILFLLFFSSSFLFPSDYNDQTIIYIPLYKENIKDASILLKLTSIEESALLEHKKNLSSQFNFTLHEPKNTRFPSPSTIARETGARFVWSGSFSYHDDEKSPFYFRFTLYDAKTDKSIDYSVRVTADDHASLLFKARQFYFYLGEQLDFFPGVFPSEKKPARSLILRDPWLIDAVPKEFLAVKDFIGQAMQKKLSPRFQIITRTQNPYLLLPPYDIWEKDKHHDRLMEDWNAQGVISFDFVKEKKKLRFRLFYYESIRRHNALLLDIPVTSYQELQEKLLLALPNYFYLPLSLDNDYFLHLSDKIGLVRRFNFFGFNWQSEINLRPYDFSLDEKGQLWFNHLFSFSHSAGDGIIKSAGSYDDKTREQTTCMKILRKSQTLFCLDYTRKKMLLFDRNGLYKNGFPYSESNNLSFEVLEDRIAIPFYRQGQSGFYLYDFEGNLLKEIPLKGLLNPLSSSTATQFVYLGQRENSLLELQYFDREGMLIKKSALPLPAYHFNFAQIVLDARGNIYAYERTKRILISFTPDGTIRFIQGEIPAFRNKKFVGEAKLSVSPDGNTLYVLVPDHYALFQFQLLPEFENGAPEAEQLKRFAQAKTDELKLAIAHAILNKNSRNTAMLEFLAAYYQRNLSFALANEYLEQLMPLQGSRISKIKELHKKNQVALLLEQGRHFSKIMLQTKKEIGPEAAKQSYHLMIKNYELALKMAPADGKIREEYHKMIALFGTKKQEDAPQLEISSVHFEEVFSAMYKFYTENPIGKIKIINRSQVKIDRFWAELTIKDYMDYPSESPRYHVMEPGEEKTLTLFAVFNNKILEFTEDTPLNAQINLKFTAGGKEYTVSKKQALNLYNRNALIWDDPRKLASFVTAKDNAVKIFAREIIQQFRFAQFNAINANLQKALQLFNALGIYGMNYISDPKTPFKAFSKLKHAVDYVQYPRDALRFKNGDCDDLSALYASLLENLGIETALVLVPEHILVLFNTGVPESKAQDVSQDLASLVFLNGKVWVPVETTLLGKSFLEAWEAGAAIITRHQKENQVLILETNQANVLYAPVSLPPSSWEPSIPVKEQVERVFFQDINKLIDRELTQKIRYWEKELQKNPQDAVILNKIGIIYGRFEKYQEAITYFQRSLQASPAYFSPQNNLGNVYFLQKKYELALLAYEKALKINAKNPLLLINLALIHKELGQNDQFKNQLEAAFKLNQRLREQYSYLLEPSQTRAAKVSSPTQDMHWIEE